MSKSELFIDIDGVICDHATSICDRVNSDYDLDSSPDDVRAWNHSFGPITFVEAVNKYYPEDSFILGMTATPGLTQFINNIIPILDPIFISSRDGYCHNTTKQWINTIFKGKHKILFSKTKHEAKGQYIIDDNHETLLSLTSIVKACFLYSRPWNSDASVLSTLNKLENIYIVESFDQVVDICKSLE